MKTVLYIKLYVDYVIGFFRTTAGSVTSIGIFALVSSVGIFLFFENAMNARGANSDISTTFALFAASGIAFGSFMSSIKGMKITGTLIAVGDSALSTVGYSSVLLPEGVNLLAAFESPALLMTAIAVIVIANTPVIGSYSFSWKLGNEIKKDQHITGIMQKMEEQISHRLANIDMFATDEEDDARPEVYDLFGGKQKTGS